MLSSKKLFKLVINNNYDELSIAIQNKQVNFKAEYGKIIINELVKLNKSIPNELSFIKDDDTIRPFDILKIKTKNKKTNEIVI